jgi:DNA-binding CsgD family transcriptional regulator
VREKVLKHDLVRGPERSVLREKGSTSLDHLFTFRGISFSCRGTVLEGGAANPGLVLLLVEAVERPESPSDRFDPSGGQGRSSAEEYGLTGQEETVAKWISRGLTNKEIASELGISVHTIKGHLKQVMKKLEVTTRSAITTKIMTR